MQERVFPQPVTSNRPQTMSTLAVIASVLILAVYAGTVTGRVPVRVFHAANAFGCVPLVIVGARAGTWGAVLLSAGFGLAGAIGLVRP